MSPSRDLLLKLFDESYDRKAWHGPNLRGSVRRVEASIATFRPKPNRHNIWEQVLHAAYWKYTVRRRILGEPRGSFVLKGSNWFLRPDPGVHAEDWPRAWKADIDLLDETHRTLRAAILSVPEKSLLLAPPNCKLSYAELIYSMAMHDVYHAGQIQLLKRLAGTNSEE